MLAMKLKRTRRGSATLEMALLLPFVLFPLTFGLIEYSWMFLKAQDVSNAVRAGARVAAMAGSTSDDVRATVTSLMTSAKLDQSGYTLTLTPEEVGGAGSGQDVTVEVSIRYANVAIMNAPLAYVPVPEYLRCSVTMAREGP
jgi:Flp pilus assembly protein TadG